MRILTDALNNKKTVVILGHVNPDGDCIGSCLGMYNYLRENEPQLRVSVYLGAMGAKFSYLAGYEEVKHEYEPERQFDLCITLDASDMGRLGEFAPYLANAGDSLCIDHHITNKGLAAVNVVEDCASSTCEVLYGLLEPEKISKTVAECLYTGIAHDTGVFKYSNTSKKTMEIAGKLMEKGLDCAKIIDDTFYRKTYIQNQILGRTLLESILFMNKTCIASYITKKTMDFYGVSVKDLDGIVSQLRVTKEIEVAIFMYELETNVYKVSLRSKDKVDVSKVAQYFGGGGHKKAAGLTMAGTYYDVLNNLSGQIEAQLEGQK